MLNRGTVFISFSLLLGIFNDCRIICCLLVNDVTCHVTEAVILSVANSGANTNGTRTRRFTRPDPYPRVRVGREISLRVGSGNRLLATVRVGQQKPFNRRPLVYMSVNRIMAHFMLDSVLLS